jgi:hypothetical protein
MCGAEGRASSQRSIDYHSPPRLCQRKNPGLEKAFAGLPHIRAWQRCVSAAPSPVD